MSEFKIAFTEQVKNFETSIGKLLEIKSGKGFKASEYSTKGRPLLQIENVGYGTIKWKVPSFLPEEYCLSEAELVLERGDIVLALNRPITNGQLKISKITAMDEGAILYQRVGKVISKGLANYDYLYHLLSIQVKKFVESKSIGSDQPFISIRELYQYPVVLPVCKNEQQKIADFLSSVDTKISQLTEKHRLLKGYKKGVRQQIFSQRVRFKDDDGNVLPEWSYKKLSKITSKIGSGSTPRGGQEAYTSNGVIFIRSQNVYDNKLDLRKTVFISQSTHTKMKGSKVQKHDVLLNITGASIGRSCVVPKKFEEGNVNQHVCIIRTNNELDPYYLQFFLSSYLGQKIIFQSQAGGGREGLNFESIKLFKIPLPSVKEQQKIAQFLQSLDKKIDAVNDQIEQTKLFKKGLLQQMFV